MTYSGGTTTITDEAGTSRNSVVDGLGRLLHVFEDPSGLNYETDYQYDVLNNLLSVSQKGGSSVPTNWRPRSFVYDSLSQLMSSANPESGAVMYAYDADGSLVTKTSPAPNQTGATTVTLSYCYDALNRMTSKAYTSQSCPMSSPVATYSYDQGATTAYPVGHRTGMTDAAGSETWTYDVMGRVATDHRTTASVTKTMTYAPYNLDGSIAAIIYPSGDSFTYTPGGAGQPLAVSDTTQGINYVTAAHYAPQGALASMTSGSNLFSTYIYNSRLQGCWLYTTTTTALPWNTTACTGSGATGNITDQKYNFNLGAGDNGNVIGITNDRDATRSQSFGYDQFNRLTSAETTSSFSTSPANCWYEAYGYDPWGNLLSIAESNSSYTGCTQESGLSVGILANNQLNSPGDGYDSAGNLITSFVSQGLSASYVYDAENRIVSAGGVNYTYDGDGKRVEKSTGKLYWYDTGGNVISELNTSGTVTDSYVFFAGRRVVHRSSTAGIFYNFGDHLNTSRAVVASGQTSPCYDADFYPFGGERTITNTCGLNYKFTGKERDSESGLDNFGARYNSSAVGRFMSPDPLPWLASPRRLFIRYISNPQNFNLYAYVRNNPLTLSDPTGLYAVNCTAGSEKDQKKCNKAANNFEKRREKDLRSRDQRARNAAAAWGGRGQDNGIDVTFKSQRAIDADSGAANTNAVVTVDRASDGQVHVNAEFSESEGGGDQERTIVHEGSHLEDDVQFLTSFNFSTGKYNAGLNFFHYDTEFKAFETGSLVSPYSFFSRGPSGYAALDNFLQNSPAYRRNDYELVFDPAEYPQQ